MTELTDAELSREVALACGWKHISPSEQGVGAEYWRWEAPSGGRLAWKIPDFATSLDSCFGPGGPVEFAKAKDWSTRIVASARGECGALIFESTPTELNDGGRLGVAFHPNSARALSLAFLAAVKAQL